MLIKEIDDVCPTQGSCVVGGDAKDKGKGKLVDERSVKKPLLLEYPGFGVRCSSGGVSGSGVGT
ncbi:hypothetical protein PSY31_23635, partial [Shigella flexneri]|nr:hypothetical protein [Shigella flexneri]